MKAQLSRVPALSEAPGKISCLGVALAGSVAGFMNWVPEIPLDVLKTRLQVAPEGTYTGAVLGSRSVLREVMRTEGLRGMFRGSSPIFLRAIPANAACFSGYEAGLSFIRRYGD